MKQTKKIIAALAAATMVASCAGVVASAAEAVNAVNVSYSTVAETFTAADGTVVPAGATAVTLSIENNTGFSASDITLSATADLLGTDGLVTATNGSAYGNATVSAAQNGSKVVITSASLDDSKNDGTLVTFYTTSDAEVLDIDGTLLPPGDMLIPESTLAALDRARANGHKLFLCTGRNHRMTEPLLRHDCFAGAVCSAGGYVLCDGKTLVDIPMEPQQAEGVRAALERNGVECTLEARDATFGGSKMAERWKFIHKKNDAPLNSEAERWRKAMEEGMSILPLSDYKGEPLYKIVFIANHESDLAEAKQLYADQFVFCESKLDRLTDGFVNGELINRKFDKGTGIKAICDHLGCTLADTIGFGDSDNDLQMTDVVGISVCMANGSENLKKRCDRIAPSVYEDGIAKEFKALGLI